VVKVDESKCIGCGMCASMCPEVFEMGGIIAKVKKGGNSKDCKTAIESCPTQAIKD